MQIKTTMSYHFTPISIAAIKTNKDKNKIIQKTSVGEDLLKLNPCELLVTM